MKDIDKELLEDNKVGAEVTKQLMKSFKALQVFAAQTLVAELAQAPREVFEELQRSANKVFDDMEDAAKVMRNHINRTFVKKFNDIDGVIAPTNTEGYSN